MRIQVKLHGLLTAGFDAPDGIVELDVPAGIDIAGVIEVLKGTSPMFDPRSCLAVVGGAKVLLDWTLEDGDQVGLYHPFSGG